jgi:RNA polymerase sigma-70 factor (ECF subfamily)
MSRPMDELIPTRTTLLGRLKDWRDDSSWQDFFDTYWKLIYGLAIKAGLTKTEAEDVVQETMISVAKHISAFKYNRNVGSFKAWLLNMTRWRITDQFRKRKPLSVGHLPFDDAGTNVQSANNMIDPASLNWEAMWEAEWEKNLLDAAIVKVKRRLDPEKFQIFDFYVNKEWPPDKVAKTFGISKDQVYLAKHRVLEMIKEEVERLKKEMI